MVDPQNPRNQPQRDRFSTPPPAVAFSTPPPSAASVGAGGDTPLLSNRLRPASKKSEVLLCDWWLVAAAEAREGRRLCVGGIEFRESRCPRRDARSGSKSLLSPWRKAERVFVSAPITKRHDAFTLGTADGITVRIQGVVNQERSHQNGFPLEVSDGFLVGFPCNWDSYAGACFEGTYNGISAPANAASTNDISKGLSDTKDCLFTLHLDDFTHRRIHGASIDGIDGSVTRKFRDFLERFCDRYSRNTTKRMLSDVKDCTTPIVKSCLPQETLNRFEGEIADGLVAEGVEHMSHFEEVSVSSPSGQCETLVEGLGLTPVLKEPISEKENYEKEKNRKKHENGTNHDLAAGPSNATGCHRNVLQADGVGDENSSAITANIQHNISYDSSLQLTSEVDRLYMKATVDQKVPSLENIPEPDNCTHFDEFVTVNLDSVNHTPNCIAEANCETSTSKADSVSDTIPSDMLPEELNMPYPNHNTELGNDRRSDGSQLDCIILDLRSNITSNMRLKEPLTSRMQLDVTGTENIEQTAITGVKSCKLQEAPSKQEREKSSKKHGSSTNHVTEDHAGGPSKADRSHMIELHANGVVAENSIVLRSNNEHDISFNSSLELASQTDGVPLEGSFIQRATQLENIAETEKGIHIVRSFPVCVDTKSPMPNCIGDVNTESTTCLMDLGIESVMKDKLPKESLSHPKHGMKLRNVMRSDGSEGTGTQIIGVSKGSLRRNLFDMKEANLSSPIETSRKPVVSVSSKVSDEKEKVCRRSSRVASKLNRGILETNQNSEFHFVKDSTGSIESVNMSITSEVGLMESLAEHESEIFEFLAASTTRSDILVEMRPSKEKKSDVITCETRGKLSRQRKTKKKYSRKKTKSSKKEESSLFVNQDCKKTSSLHSSRRTIWRPSYDSQCPLTRDRATKLCIASPESLDLKRSRAGRLLVPRISEWCQKMVYAMDGEIAAISGDSLDDFPVIGIHSEPPRKRRRHV